MTNDLENTIKSHGQEQVMKFWGELSPESKDKLAAQLTAIPWNRLGELVEKMSCRRPVTRHPGRPGPRPVFPGGDDKWRFIVGPREERSPRRVSLCERGHASAATARGTYPITPVTAKFPVPVFADNI